MAEAHPGEIMALVSEQAAHAGCEASCGGAHVATERGLVQLMGASHGLPAPLIYRKGWALLGYLAVESNRKHSRIALAALLWPSLSETSALTNLRQVLSNLNRYCSNALGPDALRIERGSVGLFRDDQVRFDIDLLQLAPCQAVYMLARQSCFLDGMDDIAGIDFHSWLETTRQELDGRLIDAAEKCCDELLASQQWERAAMMARSLSLHDPWNEAHAQRVMRAHAGGGMRAAAVKAYQRFEVMLRAELGLDTSVELRQLLAQISNGVGALAGEVTSGLRMERGRISGVVLG